MSREERPSSPGPFSRREKGSPLSRTSAPFSSRADGIAGADVPCKDGQRISAEGSTSAIWNVRCGPWRRDFFRTAWTNGCCCPRHACAAARPTSVDDRLDALQAAHPTRTSALSHAQGDRRAGVRPDQRRTRYPPFPASRPRQRPRGVRPHRVDPQLAQALSPRAERDQAARRNVSAGFTPRSSREAGHGGRQPAPLLPPGEGAGGWKAPGDRQEKVGEHGK